MAEKETLIRFRNADIMNGESTVLFGVDLTVQRGDFVYIVGKVGTGKTSIIRTVTAENRLGGGSAEACGYDLGNIRTRDIPYLRRKIGIVFQDFQLLMDRTVEDNLRFVLESTGWKNGQETDRRINEVLSGGEQQRLAIARALLNRPELIVADEPTGNLDAETAEGIMQLLKRINGEGTAIVMVTHNRSICERYPGTVYECRNETVEKISGDDAQD